MRGCKRFLDRVAGLADKAKGNGVTKALETPFHRTIKKVTSDIEEMKFNTAIASMMELINEIDKAGTLTVDEAKTFVSMLCPFAPHLCEEIWEALGGKDFCSLAEWPAYDEAKTVSDTIEIAVQLCGKLKAVVMMPAGADREEMAALAKADERVAAALAGKTIKKEIVVPGKIVNFVAI
jgi:leucyl-tRNA synthetase